MKKKVVISLLLLVIPVTALYGCSEKGSGSAVPVETAAETGSQEEPGEESPESPGEEPGNGQETAALDLSGPGNSMGNLLQGVLAAYDDGYVYHTDKMMNGNLMRTAEGSNESELLLKGSLHDINVGDGKVFAVGDIEPENPSDLSIYGLFMMNADGSDVQIIKEGSFEDLVLYDEWLYFTDIMDGSLYRMKYDGTEETLLMKEVYEGLGILQDMLYVYGSQGDDPVSYIWKLPLEGGEPEKADESGTFGGGMDMAFDSIFYIRREGTNKEMYRYDAVTGESSIFIDKWISDMVDDGTWIYYTWTGVRQDRTDAGLYKMRPDGTEETLIYPGEMIFDLNVAGGKIFWSSNDAERRLTVMDLVSGEIGFVPKAEE